MTLARRLQRGVTKSVSSDPGGGDTPVDLATYVYRDATNTGLAGVGLTEADLTTYTGPNLVIQNNGPFVVENKIINQDIRFNTAGSVTLRKCKVNGHVDGSTSGAKVYLEDCYIDSGSYGNACVSLSTGWVKRCHITGGEASIFFGDGSLVEDNYTHGQYVGPTGDVHTGAITTFGADGAIVRRNTIWNSSSNNADGGGPTGDFQIFGDFGPNNNILVEYNYLPATDGGYSCTLGYNPGKPYGDNPTNIVFRHNIFTRGSNGKGGVFGTVTSFLNDAGNGTTGVGNLYYDNVWKDTGASVPANA